MMGLWSGSGAPGRAPADSAELQNPALANERAAPQAHWRSTIGVFAVGGFLCLFIFLPAPLRLNLSSSIPPGWYMARSLGTGGPVLRGTLVAACLPIVVAGWGRARGYLHRGSCAGGTTPVGKPVFAIDGDTITVGPSGLELDGNPVSRTEPLWRDSEGRQLPRVPNGQYVVRPGEVWLISTYSPRSWDSRYFGPVPVSAIISALSPLWIFGASRRWLGR
jgi:conjugative transfer signal peptidase TraF